MHLSLLDQQAGVTYNKSTILLGKVDIVVVALMTLDLRLEAHSLKEKRMVVKSVLRRMHQRYNLSVYEAACQDVHNHACLAAAWVGPDPDGARRVLEKVIGLAEQAGAEVLGQGLDFF